MEFFKKGLGTYQRVPLGITMILGTRCAEYLRLKTGEKVHKYY